MSKAVPRFCKSCGTPVGPRLSYCPKCKVRRKKEAAVKRTYNLSAGEYDLLLAIQNGRCAICGNRPKTQRLAVDHNHKTEEIRGLLCNWCNRKVLGGARESIDILLRAAKYLELPPARAKSVEHLWGDNGQD